MIFPEYQSGWAVPSDIVGQKRTPPSLQVLVEEKLLPNCKYAPQRDNYIVVFFLYLCQDWQRYTN